jgi:peptidoglycan/xylan/chitin deacetylase (PgdA/CDA1 family)
MSPSGIVFLMYHEIESPGRVLSNTEPGYVRYVVKEAEFRSQLGAVRAAGLRGVAVGEALENLRGGSLDCLALTFDDGSETDLLTAAPLLRGVGFNATFFIVAGLIGTPHFLDKNQLCELHRAGFEIGSHSMTHRHLSDLSDGELRGELQSSKDRLQQIIGAPIVHLSCPNGRWSPRVAQVAREVGYQTISTSRVDWNSLDTDRSNLARLVVMRDTSIQEFCNLIDGAGLARQRRKAAILGLAKRALGNNFYDRLRAILLGRT